MRTSCVTEVRRRIRASQQQERRGASAYGGRVRPGSGSKPGAKGDVRTRSELVEHKRTDKKSITFRVEVLEKIRREALLDGREALLDFELGKRDYVLLERGAYLELKERADDVPRRGSHE